MSARRLLRVALRRGPAPITVRCDAEGSTLTARGSATVKPQLEALVDALVARRDEWAEGLEIDTGWCRLRLADADDGYAVQAPRFDDDPHAHRTSDLTVPLSITAAWERARRATGSEPVPVRFDDTLRAVVGWERYSMLTMTRAEPAGERDSGWLVEPHVSQAGSWDPAQQERLEAWMVQALRPAVIRAAALPVGLAPLVQDDDLRLVVDQQDGSVRSHLIR